MKNYDDLTNPLKLKEMKNYAMAPKWPKDYDDLTTMQKLVSKAWNSYPDDDFIEMVENFEDVNFWQEVILEELTDDECVDILNRLLSMFRDWNCA